MFNRARRHKILYLDGPRLHRALMAGIGYVLSRQEYINKINVFPVPDGDTGTNMALTLNAIIEKTSLEEYDSIHALMSDAADATLNAARGNSGAILAQFFEGMYESTENAEKIDAKSFAKMMEGGSIAARSALEKPIEGTIITVIHAFSMSLNSRVAKGEQDISHLLQGSLHDTKTALKKTTGQLAVLKKAGVVDAGAQGFTDLLTGIYQFIKEGDIRRLYEHLPEVDDIKIEDQHDYSAELTFRYCTECLISGHDLDRNKVRATMTEYGDSIVVAGSKRKIKLHIHSDDPAEIFNICRQFGKIKGEKADDMFRQSQIAKKHHDKIAVLVDSATDLSQQEIDGLDINVVPLNIHFGTETYIDKLTINSSSFYEKLQHGFSPAKTSQPSYDSLRRQYEYLHTHYDGIIALHIPEVLSGTFNSSCKAANTVDPEKIKVIDMHNTSISANLIVRRVAAQAQNGASLEELESLAIKCSNEAKIFAALPDLSYAVSGGRLSIRKKQICDILHITPIITADDAGRISIAGILFGKKNLPKKLIRFILKKLAKNKKYDFSIGFGTNTSSAQQLESLLKSNCSDNINTVNSYAIGPTLGAHIGPDAIGVAYMSVDDNGATS
jgi:uncharacterized protein